jgi:hypothetical protein
VTPESELVLYLEVVLDWCVQSIVYLQNQRLVFDKQNVVAFDRFIVEGKALCSTGESSDFVEELGSEWMAVITDQFTRLDVIESGRVGYLGWCKKEESLPVSTRNTWFHDCL